MAEKNLKKIKQGYGYKYTELAQINDYLEEKGIEYYQETRTEDGVDYIYTIPIIDGVKQEPRRGCKVIDAPPSGKSNPAQAQGSAITYARRYSLLMAFGLATEDDDAEALTDQGQPRRAKEQPQQDTTQTRRDPEKAKALIDVLKKNNIDPAFVCKIYGAQSIDVMSDTKLQNALDHIDDIKKKAEEAK